MVPVEDNTTQFRETCIQSCRVGPDERYHLRLYGDGEGREEEYPPHLPTVAQLAEVGGGESDLTSFRQHNTNSKPRHFPSTRRRLVSEYQPLVFT